MIEFKSWYRERLPSRIAALEEVREKLKTRAPESVETVRRIAHSLRGSGATYGFPEITESARLLEEAEEAALVDYVDTLIHTLSAVHAGRRRATTSILVVEDDEDQARYIVESLAAPDREIFEVHTADEAQAVLEEREVSLIVLDLILPDTDGRNFLLRLRDQFETATVPVVVLTVKRASQARAECFALGADDFIEKPVKPDELRETVATRLRLGSGLARENSRDPLTGLRNRASFHEHFKRTRAALACSREPATVAILAIDQFDALARDLGPDGANEVVRHAAGVLAHALRSTDFLARWNGCEFAALFSKTTPAGAVMALGKALRALREDPFRASASRVFPLSFSAGVAAFSAGEILIDLLSEADRYLHLAQESGGGRIISSDDRLVPPRRKVLVAEDDELVRMVLQRLLERDGYEVLPFGDGRTALQGALENSVSLIITDGAMPAMDGFELVTRLRALPEYAGVPIVMLTSMGEEQDVVRGFDLGADDYVVKPFASAELLARLRRLLKRATSRA